MTIPPPTKIAPLAESRRRAEIERSRRARLAKLDALNAGEEYAVAAYLASAPPHVRALMRSMTQGRAQRRVVGVVAGSW